MSMTSAPPRVRPAARAVIIRDGLLLTTVNQDEEGPYYLLPGGGQEHGENLADCLRRECLEEIGAQVEVGPLRFVREYIGSHHEYAAQEGHLHALELMFACRLLTEPDEHSSLPDVNQTGLAWLPLDQMMGFRLYPQSLRAYLCASEQSSAAIYLGDIN